MLPFLFYSLYVTTHLTWRMYNTEKPTRCRNTHFAVTILSVCVHKFTLQIVFLDKHLVSELLESVLGSASNWTVVINCKGSLWYSFSDDPVPENHKCRTHTVNIYCASSTFVILWHWIIWKAVSQRSLTADYHSPCTGRTQHRFQEFGIQKFIKKDNLQWCKFMYTNR